MVAHRKATGITQAELAARLGRPQQFVSRYELGERRIDVGEFVEIARHLDVSAEKIIAELVELEATRK